MKKILSFFVLTLLLFTSCENDKKEASNSLKMGAVTFSDEKPSAGDSLEIDYEHADKTKAFLAYMVGPNVYNVDIDFSENEKKSKVKIPDSAHAIAFVPKNDDEFDHNDEQGYLLPLYNEDGTQVAGSESALALFSARYGPRYGIKIEDSIVVSKMARDLKENPQLEKDWKSNYLNMAYREDPAGNKVLIEDYLSDLANKENKTEEDLQSMQNFYRTINEKEKSDSIKLVAIEKFPKGKAAASALYMEFFETEETDKRIAILKEYNQTEGKNERVSNYMNQIIANSYFKEGDMANFEKYSDRINNKESRASSFNNIAWDLAERGENLDNAATISKKSVELIEELQDNPTDKPEFYSKRQYQENLDRSYSMYADTYALILFKQGNVKEAVAYQEKAHDPKGNDVEANARFISYLMADEQYEKVNKKAKQFIESGNGNQEIKDAYKIAYMEVNPDSNDFDKKLANLEETAYKNYVAEIKDKMIDEDAPEFSLKNMAGEEVSLTSLKGKTVVLDFWATWCGPCKASFPGMQQVVTKYKDNKNVEILFVDTYESGENREQLVTDFIKKNNYDFHVLYDNKAKDSNNFEVADAYDVTGIPTKAIIGPNGKMKFKLVGYSGSTEKLIKEMDIIIDILSPTELKI